MEIVLAVLLLFGGFALGSITADKGEDEPQSAMAQSNAGDVTDSSPVTQAMHQDDPSRCHSKGTNIYRDLTVLYRDQVGDCEGGRDCSYNPTAFPPSMEVKCADE